MKYTFTYAIFFCFIENQYRLYSIASEFLTSNIVVYYVKFYFRGIWIRVMCSWPMFTCNPKLHVSAPDNTTIADAVVAENLHVNCSFIRRRKCYSDEKSRITARLPWTEITNKQVISMCSRNSVIWLLVHSNVLFEGNNVK